MKDIKQDELEDTLFHWMKSMAERMGWELSKRDPGRVCGCGLPMINGRWCSGGHVRDHDNAFTFVAPINHMTEAQIRASTAELRAMQEGGQ